MTCRLPAPSHYRNQCWNIVNCTLGNTRQWTLSRNVYNFIQNAKENIIKEVIAIFNVLMIDPCEYTTMHNFLAEMCARVLIAVIRWCIVGHLLNALWDLWDRSIMYLWWPHWPWDIASLWVFPLVKDVGNTDYYQSITRKTQAQTNKQCA